MRTRQGNGQQAVIVIENVQKRFKRTHALKGVSFTVHRGECIGLLGPNGAGKTTLIEILEGIQKQDSGRISLLGRSWQVPAEAKELRSSIGISLQESHFIERLTVKEVLELFASFYSVDQARVDEVLQIVNLQEKSKEFMKNLSGGQKQRLALGVAVLHKPQILFLDEPTTGLDPVARRSLWSILLELKKAGMTMVLTTHYMEEAAVLSDRIAILDQGRFIASGTLDELLDANGGGYFIQFKVKPVSGFQTAFEKHYNRPDVRQRSKQPKKTVKAPRNTLRNAPSQKGYTSFVYDVKTGEGTVHVASSTQFLSSWPAFVKRQKSELLSLEIHRMTLDDLFLSLTGRTLLEDQSNRSNDEANQ